MQSKKKQFDKSVRTFVKLKPAPISMLLKEEETANLVMQAIAESTEVSDLLDIKHDKLLSIGGKNGTLKLGQSYFVDENEELVSGARSIISENSKGPVIMGHTHTPQDHPGGTNYVNTGSWTRYLKSDSSAKFSNWDLLKEDAIENFPFDLKYAEVLTSLPDLVQLKTWRNGNGI